MTTLLADLPVAWWLFWLVAAAAVFVGLITVLTRAALRADREQDPSRPSSR